MCRLGDAHLPLHLHPAANLAPADLRKEGPAYDLPMTYVAKESGYKAVYLPQADALEAALVEGIDVYPMDTLARLQDIKGQMST